MKNTGLTLSLLLAGFMIVGPAFAQQNRDTTRVKNRLGFVDANGDGYNDNAPDHDGDGIPNGLDPDFKRAKRLGAMRGFVDLDGDGINDNARDDDGDGIPNGLDPDYVGKLNQRGPRGFVDLDGDGINDRSNARRGTRGAVMGPKRGANALGTALRSGDCDGTGPKGAAAGRTRAKGSGRGN